MHFLGVKNASKKNPTVIREKRNRSLKEIGCMNEGLTFDA
jgi:hypothetical protein